MTPKNTNLIPSKNVQKLGNLLRKKRCRADKSICDVILDILRDSKQSSMKEHEQNCHHQIIAPVRHNTTDLNNSVLKEKRRSVKPTVTKLSSIGMSNFNQHTPNYKRTKITVNIKGDSKQFVYADTLTTHAFQSLKAASIKILPSWNRLNPRLRIMYYHEALVKLKPCVAFTLKLSNEVISSAMNSGNFTTYMREQIRRQLKYLTSNSYHQNTISFVFAVEAHHYPKEANKPRIEKIAPHLHGVISIPMSDNWESELRTALKNAGGKGVPSQLHFNMEDRLTDGSYIHWCGGYATKLIDRNQGLITGKSIASTQDLIKVGKLLYEHDRQQVSNYMKDYPSPSFISSNVKISKPFPTPSKKDEVLEKSQNPDPDTFDLPTSPTPPFPLQNEKVDKLPNEAVSINRQSRNYSREEISEMLAELDDI